MMDRGILSGYDLKRKRTRIGYSVMIAIALLMSITMIYPVLTTMLNGLKDNAEVNSFPPKFLPQSWNWSNFDAAWNYIELPLFLRNTLLIFGGNMLMSIIVLGLASFSLSRLNLPYRRAIEMFFMITLFIPPTTYLIPNFLNLKDLGLLDSFFAFWLPAGANAFFLLLLKNFFDGISMEIFEAARIDGASELSCFIRIAVPLSLPIFATLAIFVFASAWNDWFWPSLIMHKDSHYPLSTAIYKYVIQAKMLNLNIRFAILTLVMLPPIVVFLLFQRFIIRGLHLGGVKG
ncbi:carbohydrate ABC transporter permease [Paenibacillus herberti]|uniref:ABC transporter permease n=1 Tax=Paenibacillus herberti TaxID=1619309 RepID=A0A229P4S6_9BACL|nr:carbohydrate ABC transporter permease [Paenibacillus herberti]OXM17100.1 ABC transporter permease [Paenibacillus herberti]